MTLFDATEVNRAHIEDRLSRLSREDKIGWLSALSPDGKTDGKSDAELTAQLIADFQILSTLFMDGEVAANESLRKIGRAIGVDTSVANPVSALCERLEQIFEVMEARRQEEEGGKPLSLDSLHLDSMNALDLLIEKTAGMARDGEARTEKARAFLEEAKRALSTRGA